MLSVLWCCWLGGRKGIWPVKTKWWCAVCSEVQTCIWPSWCHCHSLSLASVKSRLVLPFWYRLTWVVLERGPLNGCVYVYLIKNMKFLLYGGSHKGATGFCVWGTSLWSIPPPFLWTYAYLSIILSWCPLLQPLHRHIQLDLLAIIDGVYLLALKQQSTWYFDISVKCADSP